MIKKASVQEIVDKIDAQHYVTNLEQLASNAQSEQVKLGATVKILEITEVISKDPKKTTVSGSNIQMVIEE